MLDVLMAQKFNFFNFLIDAIFYATTSSETTNSHISTFGFSFSLDISVKDHIFIFKFKFQNFFKPLNMLPLSL